MKYFQIRKLIVAMIRILLSDLVMTSNRLSIGSIV